MPARFRVQDTFEIASRQIFVAHGEILAGTLRRGQHVVAPLGLSAPVDAIESVLLSGTEGRANVALCFRYRDRGELAQWQSLALTGRTLELTDARDGDHLAPAV